MTREELIAWWTTQRTILHRTRALVDGARLVDAFLTDIAELARTEGTIALTLEEASARSGYSAEHLARLVRQGVIPNAGRKGAPRVRAADVPYRKFAVTRKCSYDVDTDARTLRNERQ